MCCDDIFSCNSLFNLITITIIILFVLDLIFLMYHMLIYGYLFCGLQSK